MTKSRSQAVVYSKWFMPGVCLAIGIVILAVSWLGGQPGSGLVSFAIMAGAGLAVLLLSRHNETIRGLTIGRDERFVQIDLRATALTGLVLVVTLIVAWLVAIAQGHTGQPYDWLLAVGGLAYILAVALFRWRG
jgi:hypothetical protein